jgi:hypothetical protein
MPISGTTKAKMAARFGAARFGATRFDYYQPWAKVYINGVDQSAHVRIAGITVTQNLDGVPDTASFRVSGITPISGQSVSIVLGDVTVSHALFAGIILSTKTVYEDTVANIAYDVSCIDHTWSLNAMKVLTQYTSTSATSIVTNIIQTFTSGFTTVNVATGLPTIDAIQFTNQDVSDTLDQIAARVGAYWYIDAGKDVHFFLTEGVSASTVTGTSSASDAHSWYDTAIDADLSQVRTRAIVRGGGSNASSDVLVGSTTLPVQDDAWYSSSGGYVECGRQRIAYTGLGSGTGHGCVTSGTPGSAPTTPSATQVLPYITGNLITGGNYRYVVTFVSALGESSSSASVAGAIDHVLWAFNDSPSSVSGTTGGSLVSGGFYSYAVTFTTSSGEVGHAFAGLSIWPLGTGNTKALLSGIPTSADPRVTGRKVYRTVNGGSGAYYLVTTIGDNVTTTYTDSTADASLGVLLPSADTGSTGKLTIGLPLGPTGTTSRKLYRTILGGSSYLLQSTTADNTTTSLLDNTADGSLGAAFSGATLGASVGDTTIRVSDLSVFSSGGWVRVGAQVISYTGRSASSGEGTLTGVPATGTGSITAVIPAGSTIVVEPHLTGIAASGTDSIVFAIVVGDPVNVRVERGDGTAQATLSGYLGYGDGVVTSYITDGRWSTTECQVRGDAELALYKDPITTVTGRTRDQTVRVGRTITFALSAPAISGTFRIQRVTITGISEGGASNYLLPIRQVEASSTRFRLEDILRRIRAAGTAS